uniref:Protein artemis n=1 Tax=Eptatretus burgeri TaxID=7764 RepID=A0A8C4QCR2_EPTBU
MFLFEGLRGTVLYTGDFRLARGKASCISALHSASKVKNIQSIYIDTTFCDPKLYHIPTRELCVEAIGKLAEEWLSRSSRHIVWLECNSSIGYEFLFVNIAQRLHTKVHVHKDKLHTFSNVPEIYEHLTTDVNTRLHACPSNKRSRPPCGAAGRVLTIKPTTMWFALHSKEDLLVRIEDDFYRACYSFHSSYSELQDFVSYFNPVNIYPNVIPPGSTAKEVQERLLSFCHHPSDRGEEIVHSPLGKVQQTVHFPSSQPDDFQSLFGAIPPPTHHKRVSIAAEKKDSEVSPPQTLPIAFYHQENSRVASTSPESTEINDATRVLAKQPLLDDEDDDDVPKNPSKYQRSLCKPEEHCPRLIDGCEYGASVQDNGFQCNDLHLSYRMNTPFGHPWSNGQTVQQYSGSPFQHSACEIDQSAGHKETFPESQESSDFECPASPEVLPPSPTKMNDIYKLLAHGGSVPTFF